MDKMTQEDAGNELRKNQLEAAQQRRYEYLERRLKENEAAKRGVLAADKPSSSADAPPDRPAVEAAPSVGAGGRGGSPAGLSEEDLFSDGALDRSQRVVEPPEYGYR